MARFLASARSIKRLSSFWFVPGLAPSSFQPAGSRCSTEALSGMADSFSSAVICPRSSRTANTSQPIWSGDSTGEDITW